jgi:NADH-quinone oxidoreductase subunit G
MPCTAKKFEATRSEFLQPDGSQTVDYTLASVGLIRMIKEAGIDFANIEPEAVDLPFEFYSGAGVIFGASGGVTEAVLRQLSPDKTQHGLLELAFTGVRGIEGVKEVSLELDGAAVNIAVVSGLANASTLIEKLKAGEAHYDFVEVMACPSGCINGGGQPYVASIEGLKAKATGLYNTDKTKSLKRSAENPLMKELYDGVLKGRAHALLHVDYLKDKHKPKGV